MKTMPLNPKNRKRQSEATSSIVNRKSQIVNESAFTIVELLTVIAIIAILAAMLLPALSAAKVHAQKTKARLQAGQIVNAIENYDSIYSRMPIPAAAQQAAPGSNCFTFGGVFQTPGPPKNWPVAAPPNYFTSNSDVVAILMDLTNYPAGGMVLANTDHVKNPQQTLFLKADQVSSTTLPGVGPDLVYRDPWGNPYVITMDRNADSQTIDPFYCLHNVSYQSPQPSPPAPQQGYDGLVNPTDPTGTSDNFQFHGNVMVWSAGPDGMIDPTVNSETGANKDNIQSWSQ